MTYEAGVKGTETVSIKPKLSLSVGEEVTKDYFNPEMWKLSTNNQLILLFLEKLCKYSPTVSVEDIESSILVSCGGKNGLPTPDALKEAYKVINSICHDLTAQTDKELIKQKLYFLKVSLL